MPFSDKKIAVAIIHKPIDTENYINIPQNHLVYLTHELARFHNFSFVYSDDIDTAIQKAGNTDADCCLVLQQGAILHFISQFFKEIEKQWSDNHFCLGHILDRKDKYFEIHYQCLFVDINKWKELDCPSYKIHNHNQKCINVERSDENFHDDYTPLWIKASQGEKDYTSLSQGSNWINLALRKNYIIEPFQEVARKTKTFLGANDKFDYLDKYLYFMDYIENEKSDFYISNTEVLPNIEQIKPLSRLMMPASGLLPLLMLKKIGYEPPQEGVKKTKLILFDISHMSLEIYKNLLSQWDGVDYPKYVNKTFTGSLKGNSSSEKEWDKFLSHFGSETSWLEWFTTLKMGVEFQFKKVNAMAKNFAFRQWNCATGCGDSMISLSNIFHYYPTALFYDYEYRVSRLNELMLHYKENYPELWVNGCSPIFDNDRQGVCPQNFLLKAKDFKEIKIENIPWDH